MITRKPGAGESIQIGSEIVIRIGRMTRWGEVEVGVIAPRELRVTRSERNHPPPDERKPAA